MEYDPLKDDDESEKKIIKNLEESDISKNSRLKGKVEIKKQENKKLD